MPHWDIQCEICEDTKDRTFVSYARMRLALSVERCHCGGSLRVLPSSANFSVQEHRVTKSWKQGGMRIEVNAPDDVSTDDLL